jgi:hypothetical protein
MKATSELRILRQRISYLLGSRLRPKTPESVREVNYLGIRIVRASVEFSFCCRLHDHPIVKRAEKIVEGFDLLFMGRVGEGVASLSSHRSVLAQLRHTARHVTGLPPRCAIRCRYVDKVLRLGVLALLPNSGSVTRHLLPSAGSPRGEFPGLVGSMRCSDSLRTVPPGFA